MDIQMKDVAESLLGRALLNTDGYDLNDIEQVEHTPGVRIPETLKSFWQLVGRLKMFTSSFELFLPPNEIFLEGDYLVFLQENQGVCYWSVKISDTDNSELIVYQCSNSDAEHPEWHSEEMTLPYFLEMLMYYQCAQGGYAFGGAVYERNYQSKDDFWRFLKLSTEGWLKVVEHSVESHGLVIYMKDTNLIWHFTNKDGDVDNMIFASSLTSSGMKWLEKEYGFQEL